MYTVNSNCTGDCGEKPVTFSPKLCQNISFCGCEFRLIQLNKFLKRTLFIPVWDSACNGLPSRSPDAQKIGEAKTTKGFKLKNYM